jgi:hypothetical protein
MVTNLTGPGNKNDYAGEDHLHFTTSTNPHTITLKMATATVAEKCDCHVQRLCVTYRLVLERMIGFIDTIFT